MTRRLKKPGFTLVELLAYMGMSAIVLVVVSTLMVNLSASAARERVAHDMSTSGQLIIARLTQSVRNATGRIVVTGSTIDIPVKGGSVTYALNGTDVTERYLTASAEPLNPTSVQIKSFSLTEEILVDEALTDDTLGIKVVLMVAPKTVLEPAVNPKSFTTTLVPRVTLYD